MATTTPHLEPAAEPPVRTITRAVPNLRNPVVAQEYRRQREVIYAAIPHQSEEMQFWESAQSHEGWV